ncbi:MAG TPA: metallophosphoesterase [Casimicrobiaceae bacterium]|nr:metallophosphoesterase [Casimicrobiaceae bacterium]
MRRGGNRKKRCAWLCGILLAPGLLGGCAPAGVAPERTDAIDTAFVVLGADGQAVARVITRSAECPVLVVDDAPQPMTVRAAPGTVPPRPTLGPLGESKPSAFPVLVCDALLGARAIRASVGGHALAVPKADPRRIVVIGDTGCRLKRSAGIFQACNDRDAWPFADIADAAAAMHPDLVIHVGDYHYREDACPEGNAGCAGSPWGYGWDAWKADFFTPARRLLEAAPWIVVRGNHESCNRAGQGWWRLVDPRPAAAARDCNDPANDATGDFSEPYAVPISADTQFIVFDSSRVGVEPLDTADPMYRTYTAQLARAFALAQRRPGMHNLFMNHHPILGFAPDPRSQPTGVYPGNGSLQSVLRPINGEALFPRGVDALLSGHVHLFEMVSYSTPHPTQLVSGNGGTWADVPLPRPLPSGATPARGAAPESIVSTHRPGFLMLERDRDSGGAWRVEERTRRGDLLTLCALRDRKTRCSPETLP